MSDIAITAQKEKELQKILEEIITLKESSLYKYRIENGYVPVLGDGSSDASILFIGEAPGKKEALTGKPFCGASGKILDKFLERVGVDRSLVYITNIVKDRPQENRDPTPEEIELYTPFLDRQIDIIQPKVIATLGRFSMKYIIQKFDPSWDEPISKARGQEIKVQASYGEITILPLYHPAATIYNQKLREVFFEDGETLKKYL